MLVTQAERQFEWWIGRRPQPGVMGEAIERTHRLQAAR
jgi:shikimate 5-dehydrogenase